MELIKPAVPLQQDVLHYLQNNPSHFALVSTMKNNREIMQIEIYPLAQEEHIDRLMITNKSTSSTVMVETSGQTIFDERYILLGYRQSLDNKKNLVLFSKKNLDLNRHFQVEIERERNADKNKLIFKVIGDEIKTAKDDVFRLILVSGGIVFSDVKEVNDFSTLLFLDKIEAETMDYLALWEKYNEKESLLKFGNIKEIGPLSFANHELKNDFRYRFYFDQSMVNKFPLIPDKVYLIIGDEALLEAYKQAQIDTFDAYYEFEKSLMKRFGTQNEIHIFRGILKVKIPGEKALEIQLDKDSLNLDALPTRGIMVISMIGDMIMYTRRKYAKNVIWQGKAGMPNLASFFGNNPIVSNATNQVKIDHNLLKKRLTANQLEAVNIMCNTPDIAIIQGPPGTGKTTVIEAAITQLNSKVQTMEKFTNNLLCAFRHETVENLSAKVSIFGIPTFKLSKDKNIDNSEKTRRQVNEYFEALTQRLISKYPNFNQVNEDQELFFTKTNNYLNFCFSIDESREILQYLQTVNVVVNNPEWMKKIDELLLKITKIQYKTDYAFELYRQVIKNIPLSQDSFEDNGHFVIEDFEALLENPKLNTKEIEQILLILKTTPIDFKTLRYIQRKLLMKYRIVPEMFIDAMRRTEIEALINQIQKEFVKFYMNQLGGTQASIFQFVKTLNENPELLKETLYEYSKVVGVTNQQSYSREFISTYGVNTNHRYENVFVDEAATSSPLDLFLPMSLATRRIILVGDHKQLPNIVNEEITKELEKEESKLNPRIMDELKQTLFQHLYDKCQLLEKKDGVRRVITLKTQFRMHPLLGQLVSKHFYDNSLESGRPVGDFQHNFLAMKNQPLHWFHIPHNPFSAVRKGTSRINHNEAELVAKKIKEAIDANTYRGETIGVITFYNKQVELIQKELLKLNIFQDDNYLDAVNSNGDKIVLEIGTVDAFQGKEFDVVFLSIVYSFPIQEIDREKYSRLPNDNLLCVALSRQMKMLIVVGNKMIFDQPKAQRLVPSLSEIFTICKDRGVITDVQ